MRSALRANKIYNLTVEKLIREASDNFSYNREYELALEQIEEVLDIEPNNSKALILKGDILFCMDMDTEALECFEKAIKSDPHSAEAYGSKAGTLDVLGRHEEALRYCDRAFELIRGQNKFLLPSLYDQKITLLLRIRRFEEARKVINRAIQILPDEDASYLRSCYMGMIETSCRIRRRKLEQAERLSMKVI